MTNQTPLIQASLNQFTGDLERYRHGIQRRVIYTPGIRYLAEQGGAWWLIDTIAIYQGSRELNKGSLLHWLNIVR